MMNPKGPVSGRRQLHHNTPKQDSTSGNDIRLSKALSYLLRHGAPKENVTIHSGGFIDVDEILKLPKFRHWSVDNIRGVVENNDKQRFTLKNDVNTGKLQICANQGHSFEVESPQLELITDYTQYPKVVHGTYLKCWNSIRDKGLSKMNRTHIHFAPGELGTGDVISGMRKSSEIYIYVDLSKAMQDGIKFYKSKNNVILTSGNENGILDRKYFKEVINVKTKEKLEF